MRRNNQKEDENSKSQVSWMPRREFQGGGNDPLGQMLPISNMKTKNLPLDNSDGCEGN